MWPPDDQYTLFTDWTASQVIQTKCLLDQERIKSLHVTMDDNTILCDSNLIVNSCKVQC